MGPYIVLLVLIGLLSLFKQNRMATILAFIIVFIFTAFRASTVGTDTQNYIDIVNFWDGFTSGSRQFEFLFNHILTFIKSNQLPAYALQVIFAFISYSALYMAFKRSAVNPTLALFFYIFYGCLFFSFNGARQATAISLLLLAYTYIGNNIWKFLLCFIMAIGFHITSGIFGLTYVFAYVNIPRKLGLVLIPTAFFVGSFYVTDLTSYLIGSFVENSVYTNYAERISDVNALSFMGKLFDFLQMILATLTVYLAKNIDKKYLSIFIIGFIATNFFGSADDMIIRILLPLTYISCIVYSNISLTIKKPIHKLLYNTLLLLILGYNFFYALLINSGGVTPYLFM